MILKGGIFEQNNIVVVVVVMEGIRMIRLCQETNDDCQGHKRDTSMKPTTFGTCRRRKFFCHRHSVSQCFFSLLLLSAQNGCFKIMETSLKVRALFCVSNVFFFLFYLSSRLEISSQQLPEKI